MIGYIHNYFINATATGSHKYPVSVFSISAAVGTIDYNILIIPFSSRFGIHGSVLNWYLSFALSALTVKTACFHLIPAFVKVLLLVLYTSSVL